MVTVIRPSLPREVRKANDTTPRAGSLHVVLCEPPCGGVALPRGGGAICAFALGSHPILRKHAGTSKGCGGSSIFAAACFRRISALDLVRVRLCRAPCHLSPSSSLRASPLAHLRDYFDSTFSCVHLHGVIVSAG